MKNGKRYLIKIRQENEYYVIKMAYWFNERITRHHIYKTGFYQNDSFYYPYKNVIGYVDLDDIPNFYSWNMDIPIEGERYLVFRVGRNDLQ